jgi:putative ABC transport system substrate-binding protein
VYAAAQTLLQEVDAVLLPTDNTVISALGVVLNLGKKYHKPIFASDTDSVSQGAWAALGVDHRVLGQKTGEIVIQLLEGKKPQDIAVVIPMDNELHINRTNEKAYGVTAPQAVLTKARKVYPE